MTANNTITERCQLLEGGLVLTITGKLDPLARPHARTPSTIAPSVAWSAASLARSGSPRLLQPRRKEVPRNRPKEKVTTKREPIDVFLMWLMIGSLSVLALCVLVLSPRLYLVLMGMLGIGAMLNVIIAAGIRLTSDNK